MSDKTRAKVEERFGARKVSNNFQSQGDNKQDFDRHEMSKLFKPQGRGNTNQSFGSYGGGRSKYKKGNSGNFQQKLLILEMVSQTHLAITFKSSYNAEIKDKIKEMRSSRYCPEDKAWLIPITDKTELVSQIGQICIRNDTQIV
jgi:hypothetical protein